MKLLAVSLLAVSVLVAPVGIPSAGGIQYSPPYLSRLEGTVPAYFFAPEANIRCLLRTDGQSEPVVEARMVCYKTEAPSEPPPPPPPYHYPVSHIVLSDDYNASTGEASLHLLGCVNFFDEVGLDVVITLHQADGTGTVTIALSQRTGLQLGGQDSWV